MVAKAVIRFPSEIAWQPEGGRRAFFSDAVGSYGSFLTPMDNLTLMLDLLRELLNL